MENQNTMTCSFQLFVK